MHRKLILFVFLLLAPALVQAEPVDETTRAKEQLTRQIQLLERARHYVERPELGRLMVLSNEARKTLDSIQNKGLRHFETVRQYQTLIIAWKYSEDFLIRIRSPRNADALAEARSITASIVGEIGFDDSPYTRITANTFRQEHQLVQSLLKLPLEAALRTKLVELEPTLGKTTAIGEAEGDRPLAFEAGKGAYEKVAALYPDFEKIAFADAAYETVLTLQGLNEFYAEFAQIHVQRSREGATK